MTQQMLAPGHNRMQTLLNQMLMMLMFLIALMQIKIELETERVVDDEKDKVKKSCLSSSALTLLLTL